jgi:hypothetical protein
MARAGVAVWGTVGMALAAGVEGVGRAVELAVMGVVMGVAAWVVAWVAVMEAQEQVVREVMREVVREVVTSAGDGACTGCCCVALLVPAACCRQPGRTWHVSLERHWMSNNC